MIEHGWNVALARYEAHAAARIAPDTLRTRMLRLRRLAGDLGGSPSGVTAEQFEMCVGALPCSLSTAGEYVTVARAFYKWAVSAGVTGHSPVPEPQRHRRYRLGDRWIDAVESFERAQIARRMNSGTIRRRIQHVRRFGATIKLEPWHVQAEDYGAWIERQDVTDTTRAALRDSLRAFYRWAVTAGRLVTDPTVEPSKRGMRLGVPAVWEGSLHAYRRWMIASGHAAASVETRDAQLSSFARAFASAGPFDLTPDDVFDFMAGKQWARETRRGFRVALRGFYRWAVETGRTETDITELMPRIKTADPGRRPASEAEYQAALTGARDDRWRLALRLSCELGMRRSEVAQAHTADVHHDDSGRAWITVHGKGGRVRRIPVPPNLSAAIAHAGDGYLFPGIDGGHMTPAYIGKRVSDLLPNGVSMHALRHAFATRAYNVNRDVFTVQRLLGHASPATTQRYVQVSDDNMRALVEAVGW